jgi:curved DNA-binding protein CbpA
MRSRTYYDLLGIPVDATIDQIEQGYKDKKALANKRRIASHQDKNSDLSEALLKRAAAQVNDTYMALDPEMTKKRDDLGIEFAAAQQELLDIKAAYETLKDVTERAKYNTRFGLGPRTFTSSAPSTNPASTSFPAGSEFKSAWTGFQAAAAEPREQKQKDDFGFDAKTSKQPLALTLQPISIEQTKKLSENKAKAEENAYISSFLGDTSRMENYLQGVSQYVWDKGIGTVSNTTNNINKIELLSDGTFALVCLNALEARKIAQRLNENLGDAKKPVFNYRDDNKILFSLDNFNRSQKMFFHTLLPEHHDELLNIMLVPNTIIKFEGLTPEDFISSFTGIPPQRRTIKGGNLLVTGVLSAVQINSLMTLLKTHLDCNLGSIFDSSVDPVHKRFGIKQADLTSWLQTKSGTFALTYNSSAGSYLPLPMDLYGHPESAASNSIKFKK